MTARASAGYRYQQRLGVGFFGEVFRAVGADGAEVRITHVDPDFANQPGFAVALGRHGALLGRLSHRSVLATRLVGRIASGTFVVVTEALAGPVTLSELLTDAAAAGRMMPTPVAWAIGRAVAGALAHAHATGVVHGGAHPRSILVDLQGAVKVGDFGVARALASIAGKHEQPRLYQGYRGYLAPELALGEEPGPPADVYAAGAVLHALFSGGPPPMQLTAPREVVAVLRRAMATDAEARYRDAGELAAALAQIGAGEATSAEVAAWIADLPGAVDASLDAETEDVLSSIGDTMPREEVTAPIEIGDAALDAATADLLAELDSAAAPTAPDASDHHLARALSALEHESDGERPRTQSDATGFDGPTRVRPPSRPGERATTMEVEDDQVTHVDDSLARAASDPLADLVATVTSGTGPLPILGGDGQMSALPPLPAPRRSPGRRASDDDTPLPPPAAHHDVEGTVTRTGREIVTGAARRAAAQRSFDEEITGERPRDTIPTASGVPRSPASSVKAPVQPPQRRRWRAPSLTAEAEPAPLKSGGSKLWIATTLVTVIALVAFLNWKTDLFHPARARAKEEAEAKRLEAERARAEAALPKSGTIAIESTPGEAAVWLLLGRTPADSIPLQSGAVHQVRLEHEGFTPRDVEITPTQWTGGTQGGLRAAVLTTLAPLAPRAPPTPAFPPEPVGQPVAQSARGVIHIESTPPGAQAWLLVGYTPGVQVAGVLAGAGYELKVTKDGFAPGYVVIREEQWKDSQGKMVMQVSGSTDLVAVPPPPGGRRRP